MYYPGAERWAELDARHFPTKEAFVDTLLDDRLTAAAAATHAAVAEHSDRWQALVAFLRTITASQIADRALSQYIGDRIPSSPDKRRRAKVVHPITRTDRTGNGSLNSTRNAVCRDIATPRPASMRALARPASSRTTPPSCAVSRVVSR